MQEEKKKSLAGRPPKNLIRKLENRKGLLSAPVNPQNFFELHHDNPDIFKSLFESCKRIKERVEFVIHPKGIKFYFERETRNTVGIADLLGDRVVGFYCNSTHKYSCAADELTKILKLKKGSEKIIFSISSNNHFSLNITFTFGKESSENWIVSLDPFEAPDFSHYENLYTGIENFPLNFTLGWPSFKDSVNSWKQFTLGDIIIEKDPSSDLTMSFREGQVGCSHTIHDSQKYKVNYAGQDFFAISIPILHLLSVSASSDLADYITFYLKEETTAVMVGRLDESFKSKKEPIPNTETIVIKFFVPLKDS